MTSISDRPTVKNPKRFENPRTPQGKAGKWAEERLGLAKGARSQLNKVFPDHWSFMMGEIALYSFIILILTGTFLTFFFDASMTEVTYRGSYIPLDGVEMSRAYASTLNISFDVRGGLSGCNGRSAYLLNRLVVASIHGQRQRLKFFGGLND